MTDEKEQTGQHAKAVPPPVSAAAAPPKPAAETPKPAPKKDEPPVIDFPPEDKRLWSVPPYLSSVYPTVYFKKTVSRFFQNESLASLLTCFRLNRLVRTVNDRIKQGDSVLQTGLTAGPLEREIAINLNGQSLYEIEDISRVQALTAGSKYASWKNIRLLSRDFTFPREHEIKYDKVVVFFTLHELPDPRKKALMERALDVVNPNGEVLFVDYGMPSPYNPMKYPVILFNRLREPFAESLMTKGIKSFVDTAKAAKYIWTEESFFGGLYRIVTASLKG